MVVLALCFGCVQYLRLWSFRAGSVVVLGLMLVMMQVCACVVGFDV